MESLFSTCEKTYVIDTSGLIKLESTFPPGNPTFEAIWKEVDNLIAEERFRTIDYVEQEINNYQGRETYLKQWVLKRKRKLVKETDIECYIAATPIINEEYNTGFFNSGKLAEGKEEADPYLIAYCKVHDCTLITNESKNKPNKIPAVARKNGVICIDIYDFLRERNLRMIKDT